MCSVRRRRASLCPQPPQPCEPRDDTSTVPGGNEDVGRPGTVTGVKVVVFGATGVVGRAAVEHFARRRRRGHRGVASAGRRCGRHARGRRPDRRGRRVRSDRGRASPGRTHVVYAALQESPDLVAGWRDHRAHGPQPAHVPPRARSAARRARRHDRARLAVAGRQGVRRCTSGRARSRPRSARRATAHDNFYFLQEDALRDARRVATGSVDDPAPAGRVRRVVRQPDEPAAGDRRVRAPRTRARPTAVVPGGGRAVHEAVDAGCWRGCSRGRRRRPTARNEIFNVTNGDVFDWHDVWPTIADAFGMERRRARTRSCSPTTMPPRADEWAASSTVTGCVAPRRWATFVGDSWQYADMLFARLGAAVRCPRCSARSSCARPASASASTPRTCSASGSRGSGSAGCSRDPMPE